MSKIDLRVGFADAMTKLSSGVLGHIGDTLIGDVSAISIVDARNKVVGGNEPSADS
jgi:hypothetical protein